MALHGNAAHHCSAALWADRISGYGLLHMTRFLQRLLEGPVELEGPQIDDFEYRPARSAFGALSKLGSRFEWHLAMALRASSLLHGPPGEYARPALTGGTLSPSCANRIVQMCKVRTNSPHIIPSLYNPWRRRSGGGYGWRSWSLACLDRMPPCPTLGRPRSSSSGPRLRTTTPSHRAAWMRNTLAYRWRSTCGSSDRLGRDRTKAVRGRNGSRRRRSSR